MFGWRGTVLEVDLTRGLTVRKPLDKKIAKEFIGGRGLNSRTLFQRIPAGIDPLGPENVICLSPGLFTGTPLTLSGRVEVSTLSPLTNILGDGNGGASFGTGIKAAGYDQIVITGRSEKPVYLSIDDESVEICDASPVMGLPVWETTDAIVNACGKGTTVASIGQAGENLVRFATIMLDKYSSAARGSGAVFGSKNLKAVAVRGTGQVELAEPEIFHDLAAVDRGYFRENPFYRDRVKVYGSHIGVEDWHPGVRNNSYYLSSEDVPDNLRADAWKRYEVRRTACKGCVIGCKNVFSIPSGERAGEIGEGLEFEAIYCMGTNCGIFDPVAIMEMENLADRYGMCVVALGNALALAKDLFNRGVITTEDTGGLSLDWDDAASQIELIHRTALREGFGNVVAEGMYSMAKIIGRNAMDYCRHVKGLGREVYPAGLYSVAHATSTRGADHLRGRSWAFGENDPDIFPGFVRDGFVPGDLVGALTASERATTLADSTGRCKGAVNSWVCAVPLVFRYPLFDGAARLITAATGEPYDPAGLEHALDRIYLLEMAFNARQGITRIFDRLPQRVEIVGTPEGIEDLSKHNRILDRYYRVHGCDPETGIPKRERLEELGLSDAAAELDAHKPYPAWDGPPLWQPDMYPSGGARS